MSRVRLKDDDYLAAGSPEATLEGLQCLAVSALPRVRRRVAENASTPLPILAKMAVDPDSQVRIAVGLNSATPYAIVSRLVYDDDPDVRYWLASTSYLPKRILTELAHDPNPYVAQRAARTALLVQAGLSQDKLNIFEFLGQDHLLLVARLEKLIEHNSHCSQTHVFDETIDAFDCLRRHFRRQHQFCFDEISVSNWLSRQLVKKTAADHRAIELKIDHLIKSHIEGASDLCDGLRQLLRLLLNHIEFAEQELFVELRRQIFAERNNHINVPVSQAFLTRII